LSDISGCSALNKISIEGVTCKKDIVGAGMALASTTSHISKATFECGNPAASTKCASDISLAVSEVGTATTDIAQAVSDCGGATSKCTEDIGNTATDLGSLSSLISNMVTDCAHSANKDELCGHDESLNERGSNQCQLDSECDGKRTCSGSGWC
jgi:hypothetical protein